MAPLIIMHFIHGLCVESVLLLLDVTNASRVLATTCSRSMICTYLIISSRTYNTSLIIPKLTRSINSLLNHCFSTSLALHLRAGRSMPPIPPPSSPDPPQKKSPMAIKCKPNKYLCPGTAPGHPGTNPGTPRNCPPGHPGTAPERRPRN